MALEFIGGALFTVLYDGVKKAISRNTKFKSLLWDLKSTLDSLQPRVIQQIEEHNVELGLPNEEIQDLKRQMEEGVKLVGKLSKSCMWNCCILYNFCNCVNPSYSDQLVQLDRSLRRLLEMLKLQEARDVKEVLLLARKIHEKQDDLERRLVDLLKAQHVSSDIMRAHHGTRDVLKSSGSDTQTTTHERNEGNGAQQVALLDGVGATADPSLGAAFHLLFGTVIQVKDKTKMFKRPLGDLKSTLDSLQPLIKEIVEYNKILHLPKDELESFRVQMKKGVELILNCSEIREEANNTRYEYTNKLIGLDESLQTLLNILRDQVVRDVKETLVSVSNIEGVIERLEDSSLAQTDQIEYRGWYPASEPPDLTVGLQGKDVKKIFTSERDIGAGSKGIGGSGVVVHDPTKNEGLYEEYPKLPVVETDLQNVEYTTSEVNALKAMWRKLQTIKVAETPSPKVEWSNDEHKKIQGIKKQLEDTNQAEMSLVNLLQSLLDMEISFQVLKEADIIRHASHLQKQHSSNAVRELAKQVVRKWEAIVDEQKMLIGEKKVVQNDQLESDKYLLKLIHSQDDVASDSTQNTGESVPETKEVEQRVTCKSKSEVAILDDGLRCRRKGKVVEEQVPCKSKPKNIAFEIESETDSEVDILDDGFTWRECGKKMVKNSPNLRSYYKCAYKGCQAKKRVERDREDPSIGVTTYQGIHNHVKLLS